MFSFFYTNLAIYFYFTNSSQTNNQPNSLMINPSRSGQVAQLHYLSYNNLQRQSVVPYVNFVPYNRVFVYPANGDNIIYLQPLPVLLHNTPWSSNLEEFSHVQETLQPIDTRASLHSAETRRTNHEIRKLNARLSYLEQNRELDQIITVTFNMEKLKTRIVSWILRENCILSTNTKKDVIIKISNVISRSFSNDAKNAVLFLCYTCFLTKTFIGFEESYSGEQVDILTIDQSLNKFNLEDIMVAIDKWKTLNLCYNSIREGFEKMKSEMVKLDPSWSIPRNKKIYTSCQLTNIHCLKYFFTRSQI